MRLLDHLRLSHKFFILGGLALAMMAIPAGLQLRSMGAQTQQLRANPENLSRLCACKVSPLMTSE